MDEPIPEVATHLHVLNFGWDTTVEVDEYVIDMVLYDGASPPDGPGRSGAGGIPNPIIIDANDTTIYEPVVPPPLDSEGNFTVRLRNEPETGATVTVVIDPNNGGPSEDFTLIGGDPVDGSITFIFTDPNNFSDPNWNEPQVVRFVAVHDEIPEPESEGMSDPHTILVSSFLTAYPESDDANYVGEKAVGVTIIDNDKADILFRATRYNGTGGGVRTTVIGPVELREQLGGAQGTLIKWKKIGIKLQLEPKNDSDPCEVGYVRVIVTNEGESGNQPIMDPNLIGDIPHTSSEPNAIVFYGNTEETITSISGVIGDFKKWDVEYNIKIWGNDDAELQAEGEEGEYPSAEGDENYEAAIEFWVEATSDGRYGKMVPELDDEDEPTGKMVWEGFENYVDINIEDNECGAFGVLPLDIGNPNAATDPNYVDDEGNPLPDCYVDIYDVIEMASRWFNCTEPLVPSCWE